MTAPAAPGPLPAAGERTAQSAPGVLVTDSGEAPHDTAEGERDTACERETNVSSVTGTGNGNKDFEDGYVTFPRNCCETPIMYIAVVLCCIGEEVLSIRMLPKRFRRGNSPPRDGSVVRRRHAAAARTVA